MSEPLRTPVIAGNWKMHKGPDETREFFAAFVEQRVRIYEAVTPVRRAALAQEPFSEHAVDARDRILAVARAELRRTFALELADSPPDLLEALDAAASWQVWEALRNHQGLDVDEARKVLRRLLHSLLRAP